MTTEDHLKNEHQFNIARGLTFEVEGIEGGGKKPKRNRATIDGSGKICLFCNQVESYNRNPGTEHICGSCVQLLLNYSQDDLKREYRLAVDKDDDRKAKALNSFIISEGYHEQRKPKSKSGFNFNRKRSFRSIRNKEDRVRLATA